MENPKPQLLNFSKLHLLNTKLGTQKTLKLHRAKARREPNITHAENLIWKDCNCATRHVNARSPAGPGLRGGEAKPTHNPSQLLQFPPGWLLRLCPHGPVTGISHLCILTLWLSAMEFLVASVLPLFPQLQVALATSLLSVGCSFFKVNCDVTSAMKS